MEEIENSENSGVVKTTEKYWDCECEDNFVHPKTQKTCPICGTNSDEQPDSRVDEVLKFGFPL